MKKNIDSIIRSMFAIGCFLFIAPLSSSANSVSQELNTLINQGKYEEAMSEISARQADGDQSSSLELLKGAVLVRSGDLDGAMAVFDGLVKLHPNDAAIFNNIGVIHAEKGDMLNAQQAFEKALEISPDYEQALYNLGDVYAELACRTYDKISKPGTGVVPAFCRSANAQPKQTIASAQALTGDQKQVFKAVEQWRTHWSAQNVSGYLDSYSSNFEPDGMNRDSWVKKRERALKRPEWIKVVLADPLVEVSDSSAEVKFIQRYSASNYQDVVMKRLTLQQEEGGWKIVKEVAN